jgi:hypothetical protein
MVQRTVWREGCYTESVVASDAGSTVECTAAGGAGNAADDAALGAADGDELGIAVIGNKGGDSGDLTRCRRAQRSRR